MSMLQIPPHHELRRRATVFLGEGNDGGVFHFVGAGQRCVGFDDDVVGFAELRKGGAGVEGVDFDLVDGGFDFGVGGEEFGDLVG